MIIHAIYVMSSGFCKQEEKNSKSFSNCQSKLLPVDKEVLLSLPTDLLTTVMCKVYLTASKTVFVTAKSLNSIEYLASEVFDFAALLNSPNIFYLTRNTIYSPFTSPVFRLTFGQGN